MYCEILYPLSQAVAEEASRRKIYIKDNFGALSRVDSPPHVSVGEIKLDASVFIDVKRLIDLFRKQLILFKINIRTLGYFGNGGTLYLKPDENEDLDQNRNAIWARIKNISRKKRIQITSNVKQYHVTLCSEAEEKVFIAMQEKFGINFEPITEEVKELLFIFKNEDKDYLAVEVVKLNRKEDITDTNGEQQSLF